jgi:DNA-binding phage protein
LVKLSELREFNIARQLDSEEAITEYLSQVLEGGDKDELTRALSYIATLKTKP